MDKSLSLKILIALVCAMVGGAATWAGWATQYMVGNRITLTRIETKIDYMMDPNAKAVVQNESAH